jgi:hypothetical protein
MTDDVRVGHWSLRATAGTDVAFEATFEAGFDISGGVAVWIGGTVSPDPTVLTGATQFAATEVGQVASFTLTIPDDVSGSTPLRMTVAGSLLTVGKLHVARTGTPDPDGTLTVVTEPVNIALTVLGTGTGGGGGAVAVGDLTDVNLTGLADGEVLAYDDGTATWVPVAQTGGGGGAPTDATYLVTTANGTLSGEVVVGATPGGELGGTWAAPTVDTTHSGSSHAGIQAAAEATAAADATSKANAAQAAAEATAAADATAKVASEAAARLLGDQLTPVAVSANRDFVGSDVNSQLRTTAAVTALNMPNDHPDLPVGSVIWVHTGDTAVTITGSQVSPSNVVVPANQIARLNRISSVLWEVHLINYPYDSLGDLVVPNDLTVTGNTLSGSEVWAGVNSADGTEGLTLYSPDTTLAQVRATDDDTLTVNAARLARESYVDAHTGDTTDAHDASAISILDTANDFTATDVEGALAELQSDAEADAAALTAHIDDTTAAHLASAIGSTATGDLTGTDVQANVTELDARLTGLLQYSPDALQDFAEPIIEDFYGLGVTTGTIGKYGWAVDLVATGTLTVSGSDLKEPGLRNLSVAAVSDSVELSLDATSFFMIGSPAFVWETRTRMNTVASAAQDFTTRAGVTTASLIDPADGAWFQCSYNAGDTSWHARSRNASGPIQDTDTNILPASGSDTVASPWQRLKIICDGAGTLYFFIDDVLNGQLTGNSALVATHTTVSAAGVLAPRFGSIKNVGSTARVARFGYCYLQMAVTR